MVGPDGPQVASGGVLEVVVQVEWVWGQNEWVRALGAQEGSARLGLGSAK